VLEDSIRKSTHHEVETGHEKNHIDEKLPVPLHCHLSFLREHLGGIGSRVSNPLAFLVSLCLWKTKSEDDKENWRACTEPEKLMFVSSPHMAFMCNYLRASSRGRPYPQRHVRRQWRADIRKRSLAGAYRR
jgi:hypothetical protein